MANAKDVATAIQSALNEIGVTGQLEVAMSGQVATKLLGTAKGDELRVGVIVSDLDDHATNSQDGGSSAAVENLTMPVVGAV